MEQKETSLSKNSASFFTNATEVSIIALLISTPLVFYPYLVRIFNPAKELNNWPDALVS